MGYYVGLGVSLKTTAICVVGDDWKTAWQGISDTHPEMIAETVQRWSGKIERLGLETGSTTLWLARSLKALGLPVVVMDARRVADAMKARPTAVFEGILNLLLADMVGKDDRQIGSVIRLLDSTTIDLFAKTHRSLRYRSNNSAIKLHLMLDSDARAPVWF